MKTKKILKIIFILILAGLFLDITSIIIKVNLQKTHVEDLTREVYIIPYIGDIDGSVDPEWYFFYEKLVDFYDDYNISACLSFYPGTMDNNEFNSILLRMYNDPNIELIQKGNNGSEQELLIDRLSYQEQYNLIKAGQDIFIEKMQQMTGKKDILLPKTYNQIGADFTNDTKNAIIALGFNFYCDMYVGEEVEPIQGDFNLDVTQYGVPFTRSGDAGAENSFVPPEKIYFEIQHFSQENLKELTIDGKLVLPLYAHQQDFESLTSENKVDEKKWDIYTTTILALSKKPNIHLLHPQEVYRLIHTNTSIA